MRSQFPRVIPLASPAMRLEAPSPPLLRFILPKFKDTAVVQNSPQWDSDQVMRPSVSTVVGATACHYRRAVGGTQCVCRICTNERA